MINMESRRDNWYHGEWRIIDPVGNNRLDYIYRSHPHVVVPALKIWRLEEVILSDNIVIECDVDGDIIKGRGLKNLIELQGARVPTYIMDNHNHAYYFWHKTFSEGKIHSWATLIHIDQHTDLSIPLEMPRMNNETWIMKDWALEEIADYTNTVLTIADFIIPALASWLVSEALMITGEEQTWAGRFIWQDKKLVKTQNSKHTTNNSLIVDLDLDYFSQGFDEWKCLEIVRHWLWRADMITIATSPLFIEQEKAIWLLKNLQKELVIL